MKVLCMKPCFIAPEYIHEGQELDTSLIPYDMRDHFHVGGATLSELKLDEKIFFNKANRAARILPQDRELLAAKDAIVEKDTQLNEKDQEIAKLKAQLEASGVKPVTDETSENNGALEKALAAAKAKKGQVQPPAAPVAPEPVPVPEPVNEPVISGEDLRDPVVSGESGGEQVPGTIKPENLF